MSDEAKQRNQNLPGQGGVFNPVNLALYHYAANNPLKYVDPDGSVVIIAGVVITGAMLIKAAAAAVVVTGAAAGTAYLADKAIEAHQEAKTYNELINMSKADSGEGKGETEEENLPTSEELENIIKGMEQEIEKTIPTTEVPKGLPEDQKPEVKDTPVIKTIKILGELIKLWDHVTGGN